MARIFKLDQTKGITLLMKMGLLGLYLSCRPADKTVANCGFSIQQLKPSDSCSSGLRIISHYNGDLLRKIAYEKNGTRLKEDEVLYSGNTLFLLSRMEFPGADLQRCSVVLSDTAKTFLFKTDGDNMGLACIESYINDTTVLIEIPWQGTIRTKHFDQQTLNALKNYNSIVTPFGLPPKITCHYRDTSLYVRLVENYGNWQLPRESVDTLKNCSGNIYIDMAVIDYKTILPYLRSIQKMQW